MKPSTRLVQAGRDPPADPGFVNPPVVRGSTVLHASVDDLHERAHHPGRRPVGYGRAGTPTHHALLDAITGLEGGHDSVVLPSGLAACTLALLAFVRAGDHVLVTDSVYGPTRAFCNHTLARFGVEVDYFDPCCGEGLARLLRPNTRVVYLESPGSLTFEVHDTPALARLARAHGAVTIIDNTWATPLGQQPLALGVDVSVHALTKYIGGHSDLMLGTVTANAAAWPAVHAAARSLGMTAGPDDCWLALRGLRTLGARLAQHRRCADRLVAWLQEQPEVERVLYPALPSDPGHALWRRDFSLASGLFGFTLRPSVPLAAVSALVDGLGLFGRGYSWGGFESLLIPVSAPRTLGPAPDGRLLRISAGLEDPDDLIGDLRAGFERLRAHPSPLEPSSP